MNSKDHLNALRAVMTTDRPLDEIIAGWEHFYAIKSDFVFYFAKDKYIMGIIRQLA